MRMLANQRSPSAVQHPAVHPTSPAVHPTGPAPPSHHVEARDALPRRAALALVVTAGAALAAPAAHAADLPGFKKDLTSKRKLKIPEEEYSDGPDGLKFYDVVVGTGRTPRFQSFFMSNITPPQWRRKRGSVLWYTMTRNGRASLSW